MQSVVGLDHVAVYNKQNAVAELPMLRCTCSVVTLSGVVIQATDGLLVKIQMAVLFRLTNTLV